MTTTFGFMQKMQGLKTYPPLSPRQQQLLKFMWKYWADKGYWPTQREMCEALGLKSTNAGPYLRPLADKGYIQKAAERRGWMISTMGVEKLERLGTVGELQMEMFRKGEGEAEG